MLYESYHFISTPETEMVLVCMTGQTGPRPPKTDRFVWFGFIPGFGQSMHTSIIWEPYSFCGIKGHLRSLKVKIWNLCVRGSLIREKGCRMHSDKASGFQGRMGFCTGNLKTVASRARNYNGALAHKSQKLLKLHQKRTKWSLSDECQMSVSHDSLIRQNNCCTKFS